MTTATTTLLPPPSTPHHETNHDLKDLADLYHQTQSMAELHKACETKIRNENMHRYPPKPDSHAILLMNKVAALIAKTQPSSDVLAIYTQWRDSHSRFGRRKEQEGRKRELMEEEDETNAVEHVTTNSQLIRERITKKRMLRHYEEEEIRRDVTVVHAHAYHSAHSVSEVYQREEEVEEGFISEYDSRKHTPEMRNQDSFEPVSVEKVRICADTEFMHGKLGLIADTITIHVTRFLQLQLHSIGNIRVMAVIEQRKRMNGRLKADLSKGWDCASILKLAVTCHNSLRFYAKHLNSLAVFQSALNVRHTTFAHSDPLILDLGDLLHAVIIGIQIAEVIGAPEMHEFLLKHEVQIISHMNGKQCQPKMTFASLPSLNHLHVAEELKNLVPILSAQRRNEILDTLDSLVRKVVSREIGRLSASSAGGDIDLTREKTCDLLEFVQSRSEDIRVVGPNSHRVQAVLNGLLSSKHPYFSNNTRQSMNFDANEMLVLCHQTAECLSLLGCSEEYNRLKTFQDGITEEVRTTLIRHLKLEPPDATPPLFAKPSSSPSSCTGGKDIFRLSDLFHQLAQNDTRFIAYRGRVRTACLKKEEYIINLLLYYEQKKDTEALLEDLEQWK